MGIKLGNGKWATKEDELLAYRVIEGKYFDRSFDFARSSTTTRVNKDGYIEDVPSDTARIDFADSVDGALLTEPASTNLITYPISFGNSYWTKSGASIEPDSSTAGSELITNGDFEDGSTDWTLQSGWSIVGEKARYDSTVSGYTIRQLMPSIVAGKTIKLQFDISDIEVGKSAFLKIEISGTPEILLNYTLLSEGTHTYYHTITSGLDRVTFVAINSSTGGACSIDNISVKEVQGFEAPKEIPVANGEELVTNGDFEGSSNSWSEGGTWAYGSNNEVCIGNTTNQDLTQSNMTVGNTYLISVDIVSSTLSAQHIRIYAGSVYTDFTLSGVAETIKTQLTATGSGVLDLRVFSSSTSGTLIIDNISVKEVTSWSGGGFEREAYKLVESDATAWHQMNPQSFTISNTTDYRVSIYAKAGERDFLRLRWSDGDTREAWFNLSTGAIGTEQRSSATITPMANGWYRCEVGGESTATTGTLFVSLSTADNEGSYQGDGSSGLYIAYAQLEEQASATSLMLPTTEGSTTSRVADTCAGSGTAQDFKDYNASGVLYAEIATLSDDLTGRYISLSDGTTNNYVDIYYSSLSDYISMKLYSGGVLQASNNTAVSDITDFHKVAARWAQDDFSLWVDGVEVATDTSGITPLGLNALNLTFPTGSSNAFYGKTRSLEVLPYMSDIDMFQLTSGYYTSFEDLALHYNYTIL